LSLFLRDELAKIPEIVGTETMILLEIKKRSYMYL